MIATWNLSTRGASFSCSGPIVPHAITWKASRLVAPSCCTISLSFPLLDLCMLAALQLPRCHLIFVFPARSLLSTSLSPSVSCLQAVIPGFRKGKAPAGLVMNHFGKESVTAEACEEIIGAAVPVALQMKDIKAIGQARMADEEQIAKMLKEFAPGNVSSLNPGPCPNLERKLPAPA